MGKNKALPLLMVIAFLFLEGCVSLLPQAKQTTKSPWNTFNEAKAAFDKVTPYTSTKEELKKAGYDPFVTPNIKILTYLDIIQRFMANPSIKKEDLDDGLQTCLAARDQCSGYEVEPQIITSKRHGNVLLDLFNFKRKTREFGWKLNAIIVMVDGTVVYKLWGGSPMVDTESEKKNPLGPLQEPADIYKDAAKGLLYP